MIEHSEDDTIPNWNEIGGRGFVKEGDTYRYTNTEHFDADFNKNGVKSENEEAFRKRYTLKLNKDIGRGERRRWIIIYV